MRNRPGQPSCCPSGTWRARGCAVLPSFGPWRGRLLLPDLHRHFQAHYSLQTANSTYTFSAKEKDVETGLSYFGSRYYSSDLSVWLSVDPMSDKYPSLSPYTYCADNPVKLVDPNGEEIGEPPLKRIVNLGFQSKTFQKLFRKSGLTIENMSDIISFGNQSIMNPYTKKITLRDANSDMGNVIALTHEMTNRIHAKKLKNNMESVR